MPEIPDVATLTTISKDWGNAIRDRTVQRYPSVAGRTTEHPSPAEGDLSYLEDSNTVWVYTGSAWVNIAAPVQTADIADGAVTTSKYAAGSIGPTALLTGAVSTSKIADGAVSTAKIAAGAVTANELAVSAVSQSHIVRARNQNLSPGSTIANVETAELTATLSIPAAWGGYDIEAKLSTSVFVSGSLTATRNVIHRLRLTNTSGLIIGATNVEINNLSSRSETSVLGYVSATATGSVTVVFTSVISGDSGQVTWDNGTLIAHAYRTS